ncbi:MAG TPA: SAM-dependent chlorinase/fluorinase [Longimicrobiales bacterium]|nr:SAM-dependent chlorinase/fluorinase [Longimicrobiales bacterium]
MPHVPAQDAAIAPARITLLTDFGTRDGYVAAMKGVIATIAPHTIIDDAAHDIPPGDVHAAAWALATYWERYPVGAIHVVVVDPGVGTSRRPIALRADGRFLVGPDNGVFSRVLEGALSTRAVTLDASRITDDGVSATFHGRDIFAPAAALIARGASLERLGEPAGDLVMLELARPWQDGDAVGGEVVHVDRYGNLISNIPARRVTPGARIEIAGREPRLCTTYGDVAPGELCALVGSSGTLEISVRDGSAAEALAAGRGAAVVCGPPSQNV